MNLLSTTAWGKLQNPVIDRRRVTKYCKEGRIQGAVKLEEGPRAPWLIPKEAKFQRKTRGAQKGNNNRMKKKQNEDIHDVEKPKRKLSL